ncbi:hypothetical protein [Ramlibacter alkalitolerans]|uniref:Uncharacterized protein n=1 Tax=Ramlibacter alkalitolerans TaxID=2039631 RepID=A0ABS1JU26_9BURK|nr:hypothetical protein [Ramlibacter alkalitolerans]MBL0427722.1 hypothetical protein [Ramlibacter alkalitolerans]
MNNNALASERLIGDAGELARVLAVLAVNPKHMSRYRDGECREFAHALLSLLPPATGRLLCGTLGSQYHYVVSAFGETWDIGGPGARRAYPAWYREQFPDTPRRSWSWKEEAPFKGRHAVLEREADLARFLLQGALLTGKDVGCHSFPRADYTDRLATLAEHFVAAMERHVAKLPPLLPSEERLQELTGPYFFMRHRVDRMLSAWRAPAAPPLLVAPARPSASRRASDLAFAR